MARDDAKVAAVDAALADEAVVSLGDRLAQVLVGTAESVAEELDLFFFEDLKKNVRYFFLRKKTKKTKNKKKERKKERSNKTDVI